MNHFLQIFNRNKKKKSHKSKEESSESSQEQSLKSTKQSHKSVTRGREISAKARRAKKNKIAQKMETLTETVRNNSTISKFRAAARKFPRSLTFSSYYFHRKKHK